MGAALVAVPGVARATGGLKVGGPVKEPVVRILLASGDNIPAAQQLDAWYFSWIGRTYRGAFALVSLSGNKQGLIDFVPLDSYLYGVVSAEVSPAWPSEAQKAQAILARTYVTTKLRPDKPYDVVATDSDQRYGGIQSESVEGRAAVDGRQAGSLSTPRLQPRSPTVRAAADAPPIRPRYGARAFRICAASPIRIARGRPNIAGMNASRTTPFVIASTSRAPARSAPSSCDTSDRAGGPRNSPLPEAPRRSKLKPVHFVPPPGSRSCAARSCAA